LIRTESKPPNPRHAFASRKVNHGSEKAIMNMTNPPGLSITGPTRRSRLTITALLATLAAALTHLVPFALAQQPGVPPAAIRGEIVLPRAGHDWMSQQVEEPCILPNPKVPGRLVMFDGAWEMWGVACDRVIPTRQGCAELHIPGVPVSTVGEKGAVQGGVRKGT